MTLRPGEILVHGTCVAFPQGAVLIRGKPGSGKSELALSLMDQHGFGLGDGMMRARLVSDDQTILIRDGQHIIARPPATIAGKIELRGLGIFTTGHVATAPVLLIVDCTEQNLIERFPEADTLLVSLLGVDINRIWLDPLKPSAAALVRVALTATRHPSL